MRQLIIQLLFFAILSPVFGQVNFYQLHLNDALQLAQEARKPLLVVANTQWCLPCIKMDNEVFRHPILANYVNSQFICVKANIEDFQGQSFSKRYNIRALPSALIIGPDGTLLQKQKGNQDILNFLSFVKSEFKNEELLQRYDQNYLENKENPVFLREYTEVLFHNENGKYRAIAEEYLGTQEDSISEINVHFIYNFCMDDPTWGIFNYAKAHADAFIKVLGYELFMRKLADAVGQYQFLLDGIYSKERRGLLMEKILGEDGRSLHLQTQIENDLLADQFDMNGLIQLTKTFLEFNPKMDWHFLYDVCSKILSEAQSAEELKLAKEWIIKSISIQKNLSKHRITGTNRNGNGLPGKSE